MRIKIQWIILNWFISLCQVLEPFLILICKDQSPLCVWGTFINPWTELACICPIWMSFFWVLSIFSICRDHFESSRKFIININCVSSSAEKHFRVCWETRTIKDGLAFLKHPWSAGCPFDALLFHPHQVRFCCLAFCVLPGICPRLCPWCWPRLDPLTQALSSSSTSVYSPPSTTLRVHLQLCVLHEASSRLSLLWFFNYF